MKKYVGYIPLIVISILMSFCIWTVMTTSIVFSYEHYIGLSAIILSLVTAFTMPIISKTITGIVLFLGTFTIAAFTASIRYHRIGFSFGDFGVDIKIQYYCVVLLLAFIFLNLDFLKSIFKRNP